MKILIRRNSGLLTSLFLSLILLLSVVPAVRADDAERITFFAAASTTDVVTEICRLFGNEKLGTVTPSFASSSTLAKQISNGAPADVYISANQKWMDYLEDKGCIDPATRFNLLGNRIVLIAPSHSDIGAIDPVPGFDLAHLLGDGRLAMGDPDHVPAGLYGKAALESLGVWQDVEKSVAGAATVRAALALVERGEVPLGIVYATDAAMSKKVKVVGIFPEDTHLPITYPVAVVSGRRSPQSDCLISFLKSEQSKRVFEQAGFTVF
jgi:molybdate transport system substrate-binding protein